MRTTFPHLHTHLTIQVSSSKPYAAERDTVSCFENKTVILPISN